MQSIPRIPRSFVHLNQAWELAACHLVGPLLRAGHGGKVRGRLGPAVELNSGVADLDATRDPDGRAGGSAIVVAVDLEMGTLDIPLLLTVGRVDAHLLDAHQVLAGRDLVGQTELEILLVARQPALVGAVPGHHSAKLVHLEPVARPVIVTDVAVGRLGEVDLLPRVSNWDGLGAKDSDLILTVTGPGW